MTVQTDSPAIEEQLEAIIYTDEPAVVALIEKTAPGIHALREVVQVGPKGFEGDHEKKSWWRGREIPGRDVTAVAVEVLDVVGIGPDVPGDNIVTRGVDLRSLSPGDRLRIGEVTLRRGEKAHNPCDTFARRSSPAAMRAVAQTNTRGALFVVEEGGRIGRGDSIRIIRAAGA